VTKDLTIAHIADSLVVAGAREYVAHCKLFSVPLGFILRQVCVNIFEIFSPFLKGVKHIFEDNTFDSAVVDLTELVCAVCLKVDHKTTAKAVLDLDHMTCHRAVLSFDDRLGEQSQLFSISKSGVV